MEALEKKQEIKDSLPHLHGFPWYRWAYNFFTSKNKYNFICAGNQLSKSSTNIRKCIHWATEPALWPELWRVKPTQFWYLYPSKDVATVEFDEKWEKEFLPRGAYRYDDQYGWEAEKRNKQIYCIRFFSGVTVYFKSYEQDPKNIQTATVYAMFADEECPVQLYDELNARLYQTHGYWHMVFTATIGQYFWWQVIEGKGRDGRMPNAFKCQVSMYDCLEYMDGSSSYWTKGRIQEIKDSCKSQAEIDKRVHGRFAVDEDLLIPGFNRSVNVKKKHMIPKDWLVYSGVDIGSGGSGGHPAGLVFVGVNKEFTKGRVFAARRMDDVGDITAGDILKEYQKIKGKMKPVAEYYDHAAKEFYTVAQRSGEPFQQANKDQEPGYRLLSLLFKSGILCIYDDNPELFKLVLELEHCKHTTAKRVRKDDLIDALRFAVTNIPWDFSKFYGKQKMVQEDPKVKKMDEREKHYKGLDRPLVDGIDLLESEFDEINDFYEHIGYE